MGKMQVRQHQQYNQGGNGYGPVNGVDDRPYAATSRVGDYFNRLEDINIQDDHQADQYPPGRSVTHLIVLRRKDNDAGQLSD